MPRSKDLKRLVRARMLKTGEAYTAARAHLLATPRTTRAARAADHPAPATTPKPTPGEYAALAGMSDAAIKAATGCTWDKWVRSLDHHGAAGLPHRDIAQLVRTKYKTPDWWSQMVTVGYERIKGLRARGQRRDGTFEASKSRTYAVPVSVLFDAWANARTRKRWLADAGVKVRTATAPKSMRLDSPHGGIVAIGFTAKGRSKSSVAVQHTRLADRATADRLKEYWGERLTALADVFRSA